MARTSVVVAGPYPTMPGPEAAAVFELVRELVDDGHDVTVVSPAPSAAHAVADPGGPRGAMRLARHASGKDRLVLRLDAAGVAADANPPSALPGRLGLALAVRRARSTEVVLDRVPDIVSARWASLVLDPAAAVTVSSERERDALVTAGVDAEKVAVDARPFAPPTGAGQGAPTVHDDAVRATAADLQAEVKRRASAVRAEGQDRDVTAHQASRYLRQVVPLERPRDLSRKPGVASIKRAQHRALGWMFDAIAGHVNRLQQATIDSIDALDRRNEEPPSAAVRR